ncbi:unnamed protein product [Schistosoma mattheei]|uniref:Uncharacterized protein n=2 Tax=Schistosoma mattheei TaxID=31246 RepID=A0AA85BU28_9TREM|nr:unnamed protein product [Schistosoma mattheei]
MIWNIILFHLLMIKTMHSIVHTNHNEYKRLFVLTNNNIYARSHFSNKFIKEEQIEVEEEESIELPEHIQEDNDSLNAFNVSKIFSNETSTNSSLASLSSETRNKSKTKQATNRRKVFRKHSSSIDMGFSGSYFICSNANSLHLPNIFYNIYALICITVFMMVS